MTKIKVHLTDLKKEKQKEILKFLKLKSAEEGNYDIFPLFLLEIEGGLNESDRN